MRPCGACRALVDPIEGCAHWKPFKPPRTATRRKQATAERAARERAVASIAALGRGYGAQAVQNG
jgi:hypothetical protein